MAADDCICTVCNTQFKPKKGKANKYCSLPCYRAAQRQGKYKKGSKLIGVCQHCKNTVIGKSKNVKRNGEPADYLFCDRVCYDQHRSGLGSVVIANCLNCAKDVKRSDTPNQNPKYCSLTCRKEHKRADSHHCVHCGVWSTGIKFFKTIKGGYRITGDTSRKTCSDECVRSNYKTNQARKDKISAAFKGSKHPNWLGGTTMMQINYRGADWQKIRKQVMERDGYQCVKCGMSHQDQLATNKREFSINHIIPFRQFGGKNQLANKLSNLETLCDSCHVKTDWDYRKNNLMQGVLGFA